MYINLSLKLFSNIVRIINFPRMFIIIYIFQCFTDEGKCCVYAADQQTWKSGREIQSSLDTMPTLPRVFA